jgi:hypothetical protein
MLNRSATVGTAALQLWMTKSVAELGFTAQAPPAETTSINFASPFNTWADMTHVLPAEGWPYIGPKPKSVGYFVGPLDESSTTQPPPLSDHAYPARAREQAKQQGIAWLQSRLKRWWPAAVDDPSDWSSFYGSNGATDAAAAIETQYRPRKPSSHSLDRARPGCWLGDWHLASRCRYVRANVGPSERYVLSPPGGTAARL